MKLLFSLEETAKFFGVSEKKLLTMLGITQAKERDRQERSRMWIRPNKKEKK